MCNLYRVDTPNQEIAKLAQFMFDLTNRVDPSLSVYPDYAAPVVRNSEGGRELTTMRWGMPTPPMFVKGEADSGVTNIRNVASAHWKRWLKPESRCVVPATAFSEYGQERNPETKRLPLHWFALDKTEPLFFFAGLWTGWRGVRKKKEGPVETEVFGFLTCPPNAVVAPIHPKAMPVILTNADEIDMWLNAPWDIAKELQRPLRDDALIVLE